MRISFITLFIVFLTRTALGGEVTISNIFNAGEPAIASDVNTEHIFTAKVTISGAIEVGQSKRGLRRVMPITGGTFEGPNIKGDVLPGGADWQLVRPDGDLELYAQYLLKTNDGVVIQIIDQALIHTPDPTRPMDTYFRSVIDFEAPTASKYDYLNHAQFLGILKPLGSKPGESPDHVIISVYQLL